MADKTKFDLKILLPSVHHEQDACIQRLTDLLKSKAGIETAHVSKDSHDEMGQLCIHFHPGQISISEVREFVLRAGAEMEQHYGHILLKTDPMYARQARTVEQQIAKLSGILEVAVSPTGVVRIEFDRQVTDEQTIQQELQKNGLRFGKQPRQDLNAASTPEKETGHHEHVGWLGEQTELVFSVHCGGLLLLGWLIEMLLDVSPWLPWGFYAGAYFLGGFFTSREALENLRARRFEIDFLMLIAAIGAASLGEWAEGALLLFLFSLGHALEHYAMGRARHAIEALAELAPQSALVRRDNKTIELPVEQLQLGDVVIVKPDERIPADGFVLTGESSVNQAPITGESIPVDKKPVPDPLQAATYSDRLDPEYRIFAGTINGSGALEIQVTKLSTETTLARVVQLVNEAETQKSPTQRFTDRFERFFVPVVLVFGVILLFAWVVIDEPFQASFYRAMAVFVAASPCALAISTPSAVLSGVARAARGGVLVKGGGPLESLGQLRSIAFDKTGTLTQGKPRLTDVVAFGGHSEEELLKIAMAVEKLSDHPLAQAVVYGARERLASDSEVQAQEMQSLTGRGIQATIEGQKVYVGKERLFDEIAGPPLPDALRQSDETLKAQGRTTMIVRAGDSYLGVLGLMDTPRDVAHSVITQLKQLGVERMIMLSGDNQQVAEAIARQVGIEEAMGDLMPDDKVEVIRKLSQQGGVAMVGDGVNDAPAMATASVGIAMGAAGSDVALETADVALMADDLSHLPFAVGLSRKTSRIIRQNLWFSLGMVAVLVPATLLGLQMGAVVVFHEGSTLMVIFNALRLLQYRVERESVQVP